MNNQNQLNNQNNQTALPNQNKGIFSLPPALMQLVPWIPLMLEATTGQKIPAMTGTLGEMQQAIQQIQLNQVKIIQTLTQLESYANNQFANLIQQVQSIKSIRLSYNKETKAIDYNLNHGENQ